MENTNPNLRKELKVKWNILFFIWLKIFQKSKLVVDIWNLPEENTIYKNFE